jgi:hypothetical protein
MPFDPTDREVLTSYLEAWKTRHHVTPDAVLLRALLALPEITNRRHAELVLEMAFTINELMGAREGDFDPNEFRERLKQASQRRQERLHARP